MNMCIFIHIHTIERSDTNVESTDNRPLHRKGGYSEIFLKPHAYGGNTILVNLDDVSCISFSRNGVKIIYKDENEYKPLESAADIMEALREMNQLIETEPDTY